MRSTGLTRIHSLSESSPSSGPCRLRRSAGDISIARKTRQRSSSVSGTAADLDNDLAGAPQPRLAVVDKLREPCARALWAVKLNRGREDENHGQVHLVVAPLEHAGDGEAAIRLDDAAYRAGGQRLHRLRQWRLGNFRRTQPSRVPATGKSPRIVTPARRHRGEGRARFELAGGGAGAVARHGTDETHLGQERPLVCAKT